MKVLTSSLLLALSFSTIALCPDGYVDIPANSSLGIKKNFCVMKYPAKAQRKDSKKIEIIGCGDLTCEKKNWATSKNYMPASVAEGLPWSAIDFNNAKSVCAALGKGYGLINNREWMTIANNIENVGSNWSGSKVGVGFLNRGHSDRSPNLPCDNLKENVQDNCSSSGKDFHQKRTHSLSNGEIIWDIAGNLWEWVDWKVKFARGATPAEAWVEFDKLRPKVETGLDLDLKDFRSLKNPSFNSQQNIGKFWSGIARGETAALRGSRWSHKGDTGIYTLDLSSKVDTSSRNVTFRCVKR